MMDIARTLYLTMEADVVRALLAGNDTQCFSTEQYAEARDRWIERVFGFSRESTGLDRPPAEVNRRQLAGSGLVRPIGEDVWSLRPECEGLMAMPVETPEEVQPITQGTQA